jgi:hypothetical protein
MYSSDMENSSQPRIIYAERWGDGVIITFDDGKSAIYSAALLYATFSQAKLVEEFKFNEQD